MKDCLPFVVRVKTNESLAHAQQARHCREVQLLTIVIKINLALDAE